MGKSFAEACEAVTGAGAPFELVTAKLRGHETRAFKNAPSSRREIFDTARLRGDETFLRARDSGSRRVVADLERSKLIAPLLAKHDARVLCVRSDSPPARIDRWQDVVKLGAAMPEVAIDPDMDATILYTSGTTGHPKGAVSTQRAVISALHSFACRTLVNGMMLDQPPEPSKNPTSFILIVPLFHVTGCVAVLISCFRAGYKLVMMYKWDPARALELIEREKITQFVGVPTQSRDLLECPDFESRDTSSLASVGGGGAPAALELVRRVDKSFQGGPAEHRLRMTETNA